MYKNAQQILAEIDRVLRGVDPKQVDDLLDAIVAANLVTVYAMGREGLVMKSFAMRLMHVGVNVAVVGDMTTPPSGPGDLFLVCCGPGHISTVIALAGVAKQAGAKVLLITAQPQAELAKRADQLLVLPAQTMAEKEGSSSGQAMGSAFEQSLWILFDAVLPILQQRLGQTADDLRRRHTNME
jgi:6-phospho-3-hexuloisomerase